MNSVTSIEKKSIRFRARSFVAFALVPEAPLGNWLQDLDRWIENSPGFFAGRPVVLDLNALKPDFDEIAPLVAHLATRGIRVYAIEDKSVDDLGADLPPLLVGAKRTIVEEQPPDPTIPAPAKTGEPQASSTLMVEAPVRSGQSIFHPNGDVIVLGSASSGSEIVAGGSIHVYGTLRGRAFAGASGNSKARIFCRKNEAELLAVDGWYRTAEEMEPSSRGRPVQAFLEDGIIVVATLN